MENLKKEIENIVNIYKSGHLNKAETLCKEILSKNSKLVFLYNLMGLIYSDLGKVDLAIKTFKDGIRVNPKFPEIYNNLGRVIFRHKSEEEFENAENFYKKSIELNSKLPEPINNLGNLYAHFNKHDEAINCYKKAITLNSKFIYAYFNLSSSYMALGNFDEASKNLRKTIELNNNFYPAHRSLSRITKYEKDSGHLKELIDLDKNTKENEVEKKIFISFSLGKAFSDIKNYKKSFNHYKIANDTCRKTFNFSIENEKDIFNRILSSFDKKIFEKNKNSGNKQIKPIFILGMPRSGTTLTEQIISSHQEVYGGDELNFLNKIVNKNFPNLSADFLINQKIDLFKKIGKDYEHKMKKLSKKLNRYTDKHPLNFKWIGFIKLALPNAKIIHCTRKAEDTCFSIFSNYFSSEQMKFAFNLEEIVEYYNQYLNIMNFWNELLPGFIYNLNYESLINNPDLQIKNLIKFCDLKWDSNCLKHYENNRSIKTASDTQARKKIYNSSIDNWRNYKNSLNSFFDKLNVKLTTHLQ